ncbi:rCG63455 [Rattus norvegicus]|uniref:RCG63455 n=1 Tax=Rattus norvegicus TaxID=10116 RepID=A6HAK7_RAT|nr:rCG63455 [Rattus norvegicus]
MTPLKFIMGIRDFIWAPLQSIHEGLLTQCKFSKLNRMSIFPTSKKDRNHHSEHGSEPASLMITGEQLSGQMYTVVF